jgi:hypothetical protein
VSGRYQQKTQCLEDLAQQTGAPFADSPLTCYRDDRTSILERKTQRHYRSEDHTVGVVQKFLKAVQENHWPRHVFDMAAPHESETGMWESR